MICPPTRLLAAALLITTLLLGAMPAVRAAAPMAAMSDARYNGAPDLALASAMIAAGGGPKNFHAATLTAWLAGAHSFAEIAKLDERYGTERRIQYFATFDAFIDRAIVLAGQQHIALPRANKRLVHDRRALATQLRAAGITPDGRYDVGYMIEHLLSRPMHIQLMAYANADPAIGPKKNAEFHVFLTTEMNDLATLFDMPA